MRFKKIIPTSVAIAIAAIACSSSYAQSGTRSVPVQSPMVIQGSPMIASPTANSIMQATPQFNAPQFSAPQFGTPMMSSTPTMIGQPSSSSVVTPSNSYGPLVIAKGGNGCACCDLTPTPNVVPTLEPVTSCCGSLGPLGVPSLLTPPRTYRPPVGRQVGRPLFGKWNGY